MIPADETFNGTFPFNPCFTQAPGFRLHYVDEGEGDPIIFYTANPSGHTLPESHPAAQQATSGCRS